MSPGIWWYKAKRQWTADVVNPTTRKRERWYLGREEVGARRQFHLRMAELYGAPGQLPELNALTCADLASRYVQWARDNRAPATARFIESYLKWLVYAPLGRLRLGDMPAAAVTAQHIEAIKAEKRPDHRARTVNAFVTTVKACWTWARRQQFLHENPLDVVDGVPREARRDRSLPPEVVERFLTICDTSQPLGWFARLLYHTGMRRGELAGLPWSAYDPETGTLTLYKHKTAGRTGQARVIVISEAARAILDGLDHDRESIIPASVDALYARLRRLRGKYPEIKGVGFHSLRWSAINRMREAGYAPDEIAQVVGHSSIPTTLGYMSYDRDRLRRMVNAIR